MTYDTGKSKGYTVHGHYMFTPKLELEASLSVEMHLNGFTNINIQHFFTFLYGTSVKWMLWSSDKLVSKDLHHQNKGS